MRYNGACLELLTMPIYSSNFVWNLGNAMIDHGQMCNLPIFISSIVLARRFLLSDENLLRVLSLPRFAR